MRSLRIENTQHGKENVFKGSCSITKDLEVVHPCNTFGSRRSRGISLENEQADAPNEQRYRR